MLFRSHLSGTIASSVLSNGYRYLDIYYSPYPLKVGGMGCLAYHSASVDRDAVNPTRVVRCFCMLCSLPSSLYHHTLLRSQYNRFSFVFLSAIMLLLFNHTHFLLFLQRSKYLNIRLNNRKTDISLDYEVQNGENTSSKKEHEGMEVPY